MGCIYKIINKANNMLYIGQTIQLDPYVRWKKHLYDAANNRGCPVLGNAIRKYGAHMFVFKIIVFCFNEDCNEIEKQYIAKFNTMSPCGYNAHPGGKPGGSFKGLTHSPHVRAIISEKSRAYHSRPGIREQKSQSRLDFYKDPAKREAHSKIMKKIWAKKIHDGERRASCSSEVRHKISTSLINYYQNKSNIQRLSEEKKKHSDAMIKAIGRKIYQYSLDNHFIAEFNCIKAAADTLGINRKAINACVSGRTKTSGGYKWFYAEN